MSLNRLVITTVIAVAGAFAVVPEASAVSPRNPYRSFNLSGVNYGSMQWERAQRQGKRVWPYYNTPSRSSSRSSAIVVGGVGAGGGAAVMPSKSYRSSRTYRRR
jgi:hypothetical protein